MEQASNERSICARIADRLADQVGRTRFERYFQRSAKLRMEPGRLAVSAPSRFFASWLEKGFGPSLIAAARQETRDVCLEVVWLAEPSLFAGEGHDLGVEVEGERTECERTARQGCAPSALAAGRGAAPVARVRSARSESVIRLSLDDFVIGDCNRLAHGAALRLGDPNEDAGFTSLFLHGACGVGKTHLLQGLAGRYLERRPRARVRYVTGEAFTNEYIMAVKAGKVEAFRAALRRLDLLCIDDIHFLSRKSATQAEFLHTFDALAMSGARVALASDEHPKEIEEFSQRLVSRCLSGMVARIDLPDIETRARIVRKFAGQRGLRLSDGAERAVAAQCAGSVRDLAGAVARVEALARLAPQASPGGEASAAIVHKALGSGPSLGSLRPGRPVTVDEILDAVCEALAVERGDVYGNGRRPRVVLARAIAMHLARELTTLSFPEIAQALKRPNHSTVITACQRLRRQIESGETIEMPIEGLTTVGDLCARLAARLRGRSRAA